MRGFRRDRRATPPAASRIKLSIDSAHSCNVGIGVPEAGGGGGADVAVRLAEAVAPLPPSFEVTVPVTLLYVAAAVGVTFTLNVHEALAASVAFDKLTLPEPAMAVMVPPPQLPLRPLGVEIRRPAGSVSLKPTPVSADVFGLLMVKPSENTLLTSSADARS